MQQQQYAVEPLSCTAQLSCRHPVAEQNSIRELWH